MEEEKRLTNDEHFAVWENEYLRYEQEQRNPSPRTKLLLLLFLCTLSTSGIVIAAYGFVHMLQ